MMITKTFLHKNVINMWKTGSLYQNRVTPILTSSQRPGHWTHNSNTDYSSKEMKTAHTSVQKPKINFYPKIYKGFHPPDVDLVVW